MKSKHRTRRKHRKAKDWVSKRKGRKCRLALTRIEQNNDHTRIMHKIQFRSSFKRPARFLDKIVKLFKYSPGRSNIFRMSWQNHMLWIFDTLMAKLVRTLRQIVHLKIKQYFCWTNFKTKQVNVNQKILNKNQVRDKFV